MKKILALVLAVIMVMSMTTTAFAAEDLGRGGTDSADVTGTYKAGSTANVIYNVDITWGSMAFTYTGPSEGTWNPDTHNFDGKQETGTWSVTNTEDAQITVVNHSNAGVTATFVYTDSKKYGISATFSGDMTDNVMTLATAVDTAVDAAPSGKVTVSLAGELPETHTAGETIGAITITIGAVN